MFKVSPCSSVSIVNFEHEIAGWVIYLIKTCFTTDSHIMIALLKTKVQIVHNVYRLFIWCYFITYFHFLLIEICWKKTINIKLFNNQFFSGQILRRSSWKLVRRRTNIFHPFSKRIKVYSKPSFRKLSCSFWSSNHTGINGVIRMFLWLILNEVLSFIKPFLSVYRIAVGNQSDLETHQFRPKYFATLGIEKYFNWKTLCI